MNFEVLGTAPNDARAWHERFNKLPNSQKDVHFLPEYGKIYEKTFGHRSQLAVYGSKRGMAIQPFSVRSLNSLPFLQDQKITEPYVDIGVSYGYGGPVFVSDSPRLIFPQFQKAFHDYCVGEGFATEFAIIHPFLNGVEVLDQCKVELTKRKEVVFIDLSKPEKILWQELNRGNKSNINKAKRLGVVVEKVATSEINFALFEKLYYQTMARHQAEERWLFPKNYFRYCTKYLGEGRTSLFFAYVGKSVAAAYFLMHDFEIAYYHFAGSDEKFFESRPSNLLMWETILWAKRRGFKIYHLGGGVSSRENDSLLQFKSAFSPCRKSLYTYQSVCSEQKYLELCELKKKHERLTLGRELDSDFFPLYRR